MSAFDLFSVEDVNDLPTEKPSASRVLQELKRDDILKAGGIDWLVFNPQGVQVYVTKAKTKGRKYYVIMPIDEKTVGVYQVLGNGDFDKTPTVTEKI